MLIAVAAALALPAPALAAANGSPSTAVINGPTSELLAGTTAQFDANASHSHGGGRTLTYKWTFTQPVGQQTVKDRAHVNYVCW